MIQYDSQGNEINDLASIGGQIQSDPRALTLPISALNGEVVMSCENVGSVSLDLRGTFVATLQVECSLNGTDYAPLAIQNISTEAVSPTVAAVGFYVIPLYNNARFVRVRCTAYTSGTALVALRGDKEGSFVYAKPLPTVLAVTTLTAANTAGTLTIPAVAGLYHYITAIRIDRINGSATAVTGSALLAYTTTNLPGTLAFSAGNAIAAGQNITDVSLDFTGNPLKSSALGTATTIVAPAAGAGVQIRVTVYYYVGL